MREVHNPGEGRLPSYPIASVDNALRLLLLFREQQSLRLTDACNYLGVAHSTAHRLLAMLIHRGFVCQDENRVYRPGPMLVDIGLAAVQKMDVRMQARPFLEKLANEFGETVHLVSLERDQVRYIDAIESGHALRVIARTGQVLPAHCTSAGKALLGELTPAQVRMLYAGKELVKITANSISSLDVLEQVLAEVRIQGYAVNHGENDESVGSVAVALVNALDRPVASIAVAMPENRMHPGIQTHIVQVLKDMRQQFRNITY
ncbi:IclR family transcriptional regulator [Sodalis sp. RH21]|uniref:IclR family transcriptional regulator n=1 Tax=unclassified Sodalis (in: enterobacteria) TaxID=2636512 RepID=UPI0039B6CB46